MIKRVRFEYFFVFLCSVLAEKRHNCDFPLLHYSITPILQYSSTPVLQYSRDLLIPLEAGLQRHFKTPLGSIKATFLGRGFFTFPSALFTFHCPYAAEKKPVRCAS
jgi:hypothetical protein